jgi:NAD(P)-dependent dehydrogenase (short-subunit alcohol dehydrogenase family)
MCKAFLPELRRTRGRIVNVSSVNGRMAEKFNSTTSSMKFALEGFSDSIRMELAPHGVDVVIIEPGIIDTALWREKFSREFEKIRNYPSPLREIYYPDPERTIAEGLRQQNCFLTPPSSNVERVVRFLKGDFWAIPPSDVAEAIFEAITAQSPQDRYVVGFLGKFVIASKAVLPTKLFEKLFSERANDPKL